MTPVEPPDDLGGRDAHGGAVDDEGEAGVRGHGGRRGLNDDGGSWGKERLNGEKKDSMNVLG